MADGNSTELFNGPFIPERGSGKIIVTGVVFAVVCGLAAWVAEYNAGMRPESPVGETSLWGCVVGGALFGCAIGWLWAKKAAIDRRAGGK